MSSSVVTTTPAFRDSKSMLARLTSKNQLTLPRAVTQAIRPVVHSNVQSVEGRIVLTPVRMQRAGAVRARLAQREL